MVSFRIDQVGVISLELGFGGRLCRLVSMSLCRLYSIHSTLGARPWMMPRERRCFFIARASGGRSSASSRKERNQSSSRPPEDDEGFPGSALWDSNVENVRRRNRNRSDSASPPDWLTPRKDWTFNSQEEKKPDEWWKSPKNEDEDDEEQEEEDEEDEDEDEEDGSDQLFSSLRWGIPVSFIVLPWLLGNPVILLLGLAAVPAVQKAAGPVVSELWEALLRLSGSKRRRKRDNFDFNADEEEEEKEQEEDAYTSWGGERSNGQPYRYKRPAAPDDKYPEAPDDKYSAERLPYSDEKAVSMGGWEDLEAEKSRRMPVRRAKKASKLGRRSRRKEKPLFVRLLVALFPFLRTWGGWLSVFLVFPYLGSPFP